MMLTSTATTATTATIEGANMMAINMKD